MLILCVALPLALVALGVFAKAILSAPAGYEDERGFHFSSRRGARRVAEAAAARPLRATRAGI